MFTPRISLLAKIGIASISLLSSFTIYANVDMGVETRDCSEKKDFVQPVTNGSCYGVIIGRGTEEIKLRGNGETVVHRYPQGCKDIDWKETNPEWESKTCAPTYSCLENPAIDLTHASFVSNHEMPYENAPETNPPIFPLTKDFLKEIVFADNTTVAETEDSCQYTCDDGYRLSTGLCSGTGGVTPPVTPPSTTNWESATGVQSCHAVCKNVSKFFTGKCSSSANPVANPGNIVVWGGLRNKILVPRSQSNPLGDPNSMYCFNEATAPLEPNEWFDSSGSIIAAGSVPAFTNSNKLSQCECATGAVGTQAGWVNNNDVIVDIFKNSTMSTSNSDYYRDGPDIYTESIANNSLLFEMTDTDKTTAKKVCEYYGMTFDTTATNNFLYQGNNTTHTNEDANILWTTSATPVINGVTKTLSTISGTLTPAPSQPNWYAINGLAGSGVSALQCRITPTSAPTTTVATINITGITATVTNGGSGYTTAPTVTVNGTCTTKPTATAVLTGTSVTGINFTGTTLCTTLPTVTIAAPTGTGGTLLPPPAGTGYSCTVPPTLAISPPTGAISGVAAKLQLSNAGTSVTVETGGAGYSASPVVSVVIPGNGTCSPYTPAIGTTIAAGAVTGAVFRVATPTVEVNRGVLITDKLVFAVTNGGAGYSSTNLPTVTIGGLTGTGCTGLTGVPQLNNRGELATISDLTIPSTCTGTPTVTVSAPPVLSAITCPAGTTFTVAPPTGTGTPVTATATVNTAGNITITNPGSGYIVNPSVTVSGGTCTTPLSATATIDIVTKTVNAVTFNASGVTGTTATAISNSTGTIATIPTNGGGSGYSAATPPLVTVTGGTCTTLPTATATVSAAGVVTGVTLTGANQCTVAPILTIAPPSNACIAGSTIKKCIANVCTGVVAPEAIYCTDDQKINGHEDIESVRRAAADGCTGPQKCEWYCPAEKPVYCPAKNACVGSLDDCTCPTGQQKCPDTGLCSATCTLACSVSAPSELKTNTDYPLIQCGAIADTTKTHFRYKIVKAGDTTPAGTFTSDLFTVGTSVKHPTTFPTGTYTVSCLYGTAASQEATMIPGTCDKTMTVRDDNTVQGCSRIYGYKGNTLSDEMWGAGSFDASFRCGSRLASSTTIINPYRFMLGSQTPLFLLYDTVSTDLFNSIALGPISMKTQNYTFSNATDVSCAVKVGDGYSTNNSCSIRTCVGDACATPQTFVVTPSNNALCTNQSTMIYDLGCNENSTDYVRCAEWFATSGDRQIIVNGTPQNLTCTTTHPAGSFGDVKECSITLPTGGAPVTLFAGDIGPTGTSSFQTTVYSLTKDEIAPEGSIKYYTNYSQNTELNPTQHQYWQKQSITAVITCTDRPGMSDGSSCSCSSALNGDTNGLWSLGQRSTDISVGPDVMSYSRTLINSTPLSTTSVRVQDTANNIGPAFTPVVRVDSIAPKVTASISGTTVTLTVTDPAEGGSGLWKASSNVPAGSGINKTGSVLYKVIPKGSTSPFGTSCLPVDNTNYYHVGEVGAQMSQNLTVNIGNASTSVVAYCVEDNAGNVTRGVYPSDVTGCFSVSNMSTVPSLSTYKTPLQTSIASGQYGYSFSANTTDATCFRNILTSNIATYITSQYSPNTTTVLDWSEPAKRVGTSTPNTNGYYYHNFTTDKTVILPTSSPTGIGQKVVVVEGGNVQINANIDYSGTGKTLVIVARKSGTTGGNIYINPSVTRIDAILIADGALINATTAGTTTTPKNWIDNPGELSNRLVIYGNVYSFNTRGGSLKTVATDLVKITGTEGKYFSNGAIMSTTTSTIDRASEQDLERFRVILDDGNALCTTHVVYDSLTGTLPPILVKPVGSNAGSCNF